MASLEMDSKSVNDIVKPIIDYLNKFISKIMPGNELLFLLGISIFIGYLIKNKNNWNGIGFLAFSLTLFAALRYIGIGG